ncbi:unnamed protein product [Cyclocybe aegerita]|uniref:Late embryogenesis abundant protein LEA-2 subgroup domain-containing protein n=1 Tax=Cyclocybe aegerita TaxID=1973307 RepID=A0A8S0X2A6_CYCAE|nr:unnamed protein product [Cyclocybe aegerita]
MSYRDPYTGHYAAGVSSQYQNNQQGYPEPAQEYPNVYPSHHTYDSTGPDPYNPYTTSKQGYRDDREAADIQYDYGYGYSENAAENYGYPPVQRSGTQKSRVSRKSKPSVSVVPVRKEGSGFEQGEFTPQHRTRKARTPRALREYRYDHQGNLWTKGGGGRCAGRVCFCTLLTTLFLIISIVLSLALWIRPPSIKIGEVETMTTNGSPIQQITNGIQIDFGVDISVNNPNYFSVDFKKIQAEIFYPIDDTPVGGGTASEIVIKSDAQTNFTFPFSLVYTSTEDPQSRVILDIAQKCGVIGGTRSQITVNYKITLGIRIILVTISPVISNSFRFDCPLQASDISKFLGGAIGG